MPMPFKKERSVKKLADWQTEGRKLFGDDVMDWRFKCPQCGGVQTGRDFLEAGIPQADVEVRTYFSCIGRVVKGKGCDWSLGGLFKIHTVEILTPDGTLTPVFEFADPLPKEQSDATVAS